MSGYCVVCDGVASGDAIFAVPCVVEDSVRGVCQVCSGEGLGALCLFLSAPESAWIA